MDQSLQRLVSYSYDLGSFTFEPLGEGLIHDTFLLNSPKGKFVLQGFNTSVFRFPDRIASNLSHLKSDLDGKALPFILPLPKSTQEGNEILRFEDKLYRLFDFVEGVTVQETSDPTLAFIAAEAYGAFAQATAENDLSHYQETIPDFHRLDCRFEQLQQAAESKESWTEEEENILRFYLSQEPLIEKYKQETQSFPLRVTHNDTKINNLIFSEKLHQVAALIDLDTVMAGYLMYDFGDLVRTVACSRSETQTDWENLQLNSEIFEALLKGYISGLGQEVNAEELESLLFGGEVMTALMGLRFFTDHVLGNIYYRVHYPEQNLHRAKNQMILLRDQQQKRNQLRDIWEKIVPTRQ
ncbi:phosphotransferase enzyme family protein [Algoriphagus hitonicola]|uniref:Ser/Thr protein kinase RdoA involved in Cpx stress response, MazF antagonist n=1 Tax=Algoriphagus hitonicola TaxID=435880 RepID=A0A1I2SD71_9BACT|nr:aminoglycoside phosphotransferase family protein [Algoriphagus hitonicola]SFG48897.1 Ser/Thr protein kinase RdoA involved in Cpx stress response, MazF antagonist [Algoriphagus hitonicola]